MDFHKLKLVKCVADFKSVSLASAHLGTRQSSISTALSSLEAEVGYKIFQRRYRGMVLTQKGSVLYEFAEKLLSDYNHFLSLNKEVDESQSIVGELTIATSYGISASDWFIRKVCSFIDNYPDLKLKIIPYKDGDIEDPTVDIFICPRLFQNQKLGQEFIQDTIEQITFRLFAATSYIEKFGLPKKTEDLDQHHLIAFSKSSTNPFLDVDSLLNVGRDITNPRALSLEINNNIGLLKMIRHGYGIGVIPLEEGLKEGLITLLDAKHFLSIENCFTYPKLSPKAPLIQLIRAYFISI